MTEPRINDRDARRVAESAREADWRLPSFGKELFLGSLRLDLIHPQPELDPQAVATGEAFLAELRAFLERTVDPLLIEREGKIPDGVIDGLKELGALGMNIPVEYGGLGLGHVYYHRGLALAASFHSSLGALLSAHQSIGLSEPLRMFGTEEQKREWLPKLARTHISAFLLTEPDAGSDPARITATATPTADGGGYRINGTKLWATNGTVADVVVVMAVVPRSAGHKGGITAFIVPCDTPGVTVEHRNEFMGLRGLENSVTRLDDVVVPAGNVIGGERLGLKIALTTLNTGRLSLPAISAAAATAALKIAREFGAERVQWGRPVGEHEAVAQKIAFIAGTAFALEAMVDVASRLADEQRNDIRIEAALAKLYASEMGWQVVDAMVQVRGGRGFETAQSLLNRGEKPVAAEQMLRDMRGSRILEGSSELMHLFIAREAVDKHLQVAGGLIAPDVATRDRARAALTATRFYAWWLPKLAVGPGLRPTSYGEFGPLATHVRFVERSARKLARSTFYAIGRWQARLERKQAFLGRIVDVGAELFAMSAACVYAHTISRDDPAHRDEALELADLFCRQARRRVDRIFHEMWVNDDAEDYDAARKVLEGRYTFFERAVVDPFARSTSRDGALIDLTQHEDRPGVDVPGTPARSRDP